MVIKNHIVCNKERELGVMATQISNIEKQNTRIENKLDKMSGNIQKNYATKNELHEVEQRLSLKNDYQDMRYDSVFNFLKNNWFQLILLLATITVGIIVIKGGI